MYQNEFVARSQLIHLASQQGIYHTHLLVDEKKTEEVCTPVPTNSAVYTGIHYLVTGKWDYREVSRKSNGPPNNTPISLKHQQEQYLQSKLQLNH